MTTRFSKSLNIPGSTVRSGKKWSIDTAVNPPMTTLRELQASVEEMREVVQNRYRGAAPLTPFLESGKEKFRLELSRKHVGDSEIQLETVL